MRALINSLCALQDPVGPWVHGSFWVVVRGPATKQGPWTTLKSTPERALINSLCALEDPVGPWLHGSFWVVVRGPATKQGPWTALKSAPD